MRIKQKSKIMNYIFIISIICCLLVGCSKKTNTITTDTIITNTISADTITTDIIFDNNLLKDFSIDKKFINSIEYTPDGFILLSSANQFYLLGSGGIASIFENWNSKNSIESFTITSDSILVVISGKSLYQANADTSFVKIADIPDNNIGITSKYDNIYVYERIFKNEKKNYSIYQLSRDEKITTLVTISTPVLSVFERPLQLIFSTNNILFSVEIKTKKLFQILALPPKNNIISIVGDDIHHALYFSTNEAIYRIKNTQLELVSDKFGGILKYDGEGLLIFNPDENYIVRFRNNILYH